ncbi:MAG: ribosome small subunit-dependent GTPase A [Pirellulales bacterium]|jgi:ribosome biogenesis GTPase|nr:ribosome small subunit-dependent GTPase A [Thermoguttaceae bacterium]MDD4788397.1 ribosome small subunit-dependent GTPase A [Pirellulales bacterium]MDI9446037.1 ribosome small subunit-dependent GTPase A [Planctomycetota bacterium]NLZ03187.1 ribosome small subunit-dependent GTPase A [Pirellulaceae bacterium]
MGKKSQKLRAQFRKNRSRRARGKSWTREFKNHGFEDHDLPQEERVSGKGALTRHRTVVGEEVAGKGGEPHLGVRLEVDPSVCRAGRVLSVHGLTCLVRDEETGRDYDCAVRRVLKTLSTDQRHVVAAGDRVQFRPIASSDLREGVIERVEPRRGSICRASRGRQHVLVTNVDQVLIVASAAQPRLKPHLIDRLLIAAEKMLVRPVICINKVDLVDRAGLQPLVGVYSRMGYRVLLASATTGFGIDRLRRCLKGAESVLAGQSGVGKSSLLNAVDGGLDLPVAEVSQENQKGRHTTTTATLFPLRCGGYVVDTPGIRQFQLWDVIPEEVPGFFRDLRPYVSLCRFPNCTHTHEDQCAVKDAVADGRIDDRRYESYCYLYESGML